jgi:NAD(P)-dependent dehydrogenase (short-subunit alcohol dehydrogenase family)
MPAETERAKRGDRPLAGRSAVVTGASSGIGRAIALALASAGAQVLAIGRDGDRLRTLADAASAGGTTMEALVCDLTDDDEIRALAGRISSLDTLVHAAGTIDFGSVEDAPVGQLDQQLRVNLRAPYLLTQALLPILRERRGHVVFVNSSAGIRSGAGTAGYGATKHALRGFADALRDEVNEAGLRVTSIYPGRTRTPMQASVYRWEGRPEPLAGLLEPEDVASMVVAVLSLPPRAEVTDVHLRPAIPPHLRGQA